MLYAFLPWIAFKMILLIPVSDKLLTLKIALFTAAGICIYRALKGLDKGVIAWGSGTFFVFSLIMVVGLNNVWYMNHLGVFSNGTLASLVWISILRGEPFTLAYAKQRIDPKYWDAPLFIHKNYRITAAWGFSFSIGLVDALLRLQYPGVPGYVFEIVDSGAMLVAILFTTHLSKPPKPQGADPSNSAIKEQVQL